MRRHARKGGGHQVEVEIKGVGARGDGVGDYAGRPVFVPQALTGDRLRVRLVAEKSGGWRGEPVELLSEGPGHREPPCPHFGPCGGCSVQHLDSAPYADWKRGLLVEAFVRQDLPTNAIGALVGVPERSRRRASLAAQRRGRRIFLGFHRRASHDVVDLSDCLVLSPGLFRLLVPLREALAPLLSDGEVADVVAIETEVGPDLLILSATAPGIEAREALSTLAVDVGVARISWADGPMAVPEPVVVRRTPVIRFADTAVAVPPGGFLQPTREGEAALVQAVLAGLPAASGRYLDLFAGSGTFSLPLAAGGPVKAVEGDEAALTALQAAARAVGLEGRLVVERRDLARRPYLSQELAGFDAVVFDPPRIGAREQAQQLAASPVPRVIAVSCNPATLARDARILVDGGYEITSVTPVDQFLWTAHLEAVAVFSRGG